MISTSLSHFSGWSGAKERFKRRGRGERTAERLAGIKSSPAFTGEGGKNLKETLTNLFLSLLLHPPPPSPPPAAPLSFPLWAPFPLPPSPSHSSTVLRTESSPRILQSSLRRCCISGMPASWASSRCFSSVRERRVAVSSCSKRQPPSPSNCSR